MLRINKLTSHLFSKPCQGSKSNCCPITYDSSGEIGIITFSKPPANLIAGDLVSSLDESFETLKNNPKIKGIIIIGGNTI